jgi:hypothetical protein
MPKKKNGTKEKIHGKTVKVGKGTGERVGKRAKGAMMSRAEKIRRELRGVFADG